ncbi:N-acetylated-alpha-linked acidic dipeptidase 2-like [Lytechinus variegatus]|uniref:N-acetylated-alpha-linked acidic dipeptidase 2-like n=1 Tax=Lytechinus variegatus TaxID=7654 RepID=UPI001BB12CE3|nr:N-acetylated-alpha-linked acidic dipeptidase 2-like [Lytechinus variegatus]
MSSPKHSPVRAALSMQLKAHPNLYSKTEESWNAGRMEEDAFMQNRGSNSANHRNTHHANSTDSKICCMSRKSLWIIGAVACVFLAIALGFLIGFFTHYAVSKSSVTMTTAKRKEMHRQAVGSVTQTSIGEYERLHAGQQCQIGSSSCPGNLTQTLASQLSSMGFKVSTSMYSVLVSYPDMTRMSSIRSVDPQGNTLQMVQLYGGEQDAGPNYNIAPARGPAQFSGSGQVSVGDQVPLGSADTVLVGTGGDSMVLTSGGSQAMPVYTPYTASGTAQGDLVYVNFGREADFQTLRDLGVEVSGKIGLARQGQGSAVDQAKVAARHGISGLLLYPDPDDMTSDMPMTSVITPDMSGMSGDPLTPGCPARDGIFRTSMNSVDLPSIPIQPVSMATAAMLLTNLTGIAAEGDWVGGLNVSYQIGLTGETRQPWFVELDIHNDVIQKPVYDVVGTIQGSEYPDEYVLLGGHYSSMMTSMVTAGSSSAVMESARVISEMMESGWMPRRTIMVGLWEGSEFGQVGSTEWVEDNRVILRDRAVAYIDLAGGGTGTILNAQSSPMLRGVLMESAEKIGISSMVNLDALSGMGDYVPFSHSVGIPSASIEIMSSHDINIEMLPTDGGAIMGVSSAQLGTQVILSLADDDVLNLDAGAMADTVMTYVDNIDTVLSSTMSPDEPMFAEGAITMLRSAATDYMMAVQGLQDAIGSDSIIDSPITMTMVNSRLMTMERSFIDDTIGGSMGSVLYGTSGTDTLSTVSQMMLNETGTVSVEMVHQTLSRLQCTIQSATQSVGMSLS